MNGLFEFAAGSVSGKCHRSTHNNNQDAYAYWVGDAAAIAVVCDGCGSSPHSEVGAKIGTRLVIETVKQKLINQPDAEGHLAPDFWQQVQQALLRHLDEFVSAMGGNYTQTIVDYCLFTIVGVLLTPVTAWVFAVGDGVIVVNGCVQVLGPFPENAPPYLAYGLLEGGNVPTWQMHQQLAIADLDMVAIGTDGVEDLLHLADQTLPGKPEQIQPLSQFWQQDRYFTNPSLLQRRLTMINREAIKPDWQQHQLIKETGRLPDDTTLIVIRKR
jgi:hypothetical protein